MSITWDGAYVSGGAPVTAVTVDTLRTRLGAGTSVTDAQLQEAIDAAAGILVPKLKVGWELPTPPPPVVTALSLIAADLWRTTNSAGTSSDYGDVTVPAGSTVNSYLLAKYRVLWGDYANPSTMVG